MFEIFVPRKVPGEGVGEGEDGGVAWEGGNLRNLWNLGQFTHVSNSPS